MAHFHISAEIQRAALDCKQWELFLYSGGGGFDFIRRQISADKICSLVSAIPEADFSPDNLEEAAIVAAHSFSACGNYGDYDAVLFEGSARECIAFMAALPRVDRAEFISACAREIGEFQAAQFEKNGENKYGFDLLAYDSATAILNPFTSECARFPYTAAQAAENYGARFLQLWERGAIEHYGDAAHCLD